MNEDLNIYVDKELKKLSESTETDSRTTDHHVAYTHKLLTT